MSDERQYIWPVRWETFQHYPFDPQRGPTFIKQYTAQLDDERYLELPCRARALLHDLRMICAVTRGRVPRDTRAISRHRHRQTFRSDLEALNHAGLIEFCSRAQIETYIEGLLASRAPVPSREVPKAVKAEELSPALDVTSKNGREIEKLGDHPYLTRLLAEYGTSPEAEAKIRRAATGKPEAAIVVALEASQGPNVNDPLAVALTELARRPTPDPEP